MCYSIFKGLRQWQLDLASEISQTLKERNRQIISQVDGHTTITKASLLRYLVLFVDLHSSTYLEASLFKEDRLNSNCSRLTISAPK